MTNPSIEANNAQLPNAEVPQILYREMQVTEQQLPTEQQNNA